MEPNKDSIEYWATLPLEIATEILRKAGLVGGKLFAVDRNVYDLANDEFVQQLLDNIVVIKDEEEKSLSVMTKDHMQKMHIEVYIGNDILFYTQGDFTVFPQYLKSVFAVALAVFVNQHSTPGNFAFGVDIATIPQQPSVPYHEILHTFAKMFNVSANQMNNGITQPLNLQLAPPKILSLFI